MKIRQTIGSLAVAAVLLLASRAQGVDVTACGQVIPAHSTGVLLADLICPASDPLTFDAGVILQTGATLDLAGHRLEMGDDGGNLAGVDCHGRCTVTSSVAGGAVVGNATANGTATGILVDGGSGRVSNLRVERFTQGVVGSGRSLLLRNLELIDNSTYGAAALAGSIRVSDSVASGNQIAFAAGKQITALRSSATGNRTGLLAQVAVRATDTQLTGNSVVGIDCWNGARLGSVALRDSTVTDNGIYDILSGRLPRLFGSTCGVSHAAGTGDSWGVCTDD